MRGGVEEGHRYGVTVVTEMYLPPHRLLYRSVRTLRLRKTAAVVARPVSHRFVNRRWERHCRGVSHARTVFRRAARRPRPLTVKNLHPWSVCTFSELAFFVPRPLLLSSSNQRYVRVEKITVRHHRRRRSTDIRRRVRSRPLDCVLAVRRAVHLMGPRYHPAVHVVGRLSRRPAARFVGLRRQRPAIHIVRAFRTLYFMGPLYHRRPFDFGSGSGGQTERLRQQPGELVVRRRRRRLPLVGRIGLRRKL